MVHSRDDITYDQQGQILYEQTSTKQGSDTFITPNTYTGSITVQTTISAIATRPLKLSYVLMDPNSSPLLPDR